LIFYSQGKLIINLMINNQNLVYISLKFAIFFHLVQKNAIHSYNQAISIDIHDLFLLFYHYLKIQV
jgi:hypothetical protein